MNQSRPNPNAIRRTKDGVKRAFHALRNKGYNARMNFSCCSSCAAAELPDDKPSVFYHHQDAEYFAESGILNIRYFVPGNGVDAVELEKFAKVIVSELERNGLKVSWNGDIRTTIVVNTNRQTLNTITFTSRGSFYGCDKPGNQAGEYVKADIARDLLEALKVIVEHGGIGPESMFEDALDAIARAEGGRS